MTKDAFYFTHDSNARNDERIISVRMKYGMEGYGIYFAIIEKLREGADYKCVKDYNNIAFDLRVDASKIKDIVENFGLFTFTENGECFYSESLIRRMDSYDSMKKKRSTAGKKGMASRWGKPENQKVNNSVITELSENITIKEIKEIKEIKDKEITPIGVTKKKFTKPTFDQVHEYCQQRKNSVDPHRFIDYYESKGWVVGTAAMKDWRAAVRTWERNGNKNYNGTTKTTGTGEWTHSSFSE